MKKGVASYPLSQTLGLCTAAISRNITRDEIIEGGARDGRGGTGEKKKESEREEGRQAVLDGDDETNRLERSSMHTHYNNKSTCVEYQMWMIKGFKYARSVGLSVTKISLKSKHHLCQIIGSYL